jgi:hypothetical protein
VLCVANVGTVKLGVTLRFVDVRSGVTVANKVIQLAPTGSAPAPDPCLAVSAAEITATTAGFTTAAAKPQAASADASPLVVGMISVEYPVFTRNPLGRAATASVQVRAPGSDGNMKTVATYALESATLIPPRH